MQITRSFAGLFGLFAAGCTSMQQPKLRPVGHVDLPKYMGPWRVIAFMDNSVERNFTNAVESYELRSPTKIGVHFEWNDKTLNGPKKTHDFTGTVADPLTNAEWKMKLFPLFRASYIIIAVDQRYQWAAVAHPSRKFGWVLARQPHLDSGKYAEIMRTFSAQGYDTSKFVKVPQP